jgi:hypothetical protein
MSGGFAVAVPLPFDGVVRVARVRARHSARPGAPMIPSKRHYSGTCSTNRGGTTLALCHCGSSAGFDRERRPPIQRLLLGQAAGFRKEAGRVFFRRMSNAKRA